MLVDEYTQIVLKSKNLNSIKKKYDLDSTLNTGDVANVLISKLSRGSNIKVKVQCDYCGKILNIPYKRFNLNTKVIPKYACSNKKCSNEKIKDVCLFKYGVENPFQINSVKAKSKKTMVEKYGVDHPMKSDLIKDKIKKTCMEKYGETSYSKTDEYLEKTKKTNLRRYGVEFGLSSDTIRNKGKMTSLDKYGTEYPSQSKEFRESVEKTSMDKWGVKCNLQSNETKDKIKESHIKKYGYENKVFSDEFRIKNYKMCQDINYIKYNGDSNSIFNCDEGKDHEFIISSDNYISRKLNKSTICTICNPIGSIYSNKQKELYDFISNIYENDPIMDYKDGLHIDILCEEIMIGFEFNGLYWHSSVYKDKNYHIDKTNYFKEKGIRIIHIWEDDWDHNQDIIKSQIKNLLGKSDRIYARKCTFREVSIKESTPFLNNNHIQGRDRSSKKYGLYYNDELISLMTLNKVEGRKKMMESEWNLSRFCNKKGISVIGGASKLLTNFIKLNNVSRIISYADNDWSIGNLYEKLNFKLINTSNPDYKYKVGDKRVHKQNFKRSKLPNNISEKKYTEDMGYHKIWDCGKLKYELIIN